MKRMRFFVLSFLVIATPSFSNANKAEQPEAPVEQQTTESSWGRTLLHGTSFIATGLTSCVGFFLFLAEPHASEATSYLTLSALFALPCISSGVALYDLDHKKQPAATTIGQNKQKKPPANFNL